MEWARAENQRVGFMHIMLVTTLLLLSYTYSASQVATNKTRVEEIEAAVDSYRAVGLNSARSQIYATINHEDLLSGKMLEINSGSEVLTGYNAELLNSIDSDEFMIANASCQTTLPQRCSYLTWWVGRKYAAHFVAPPEKTDIKSAGTNQSVPRILNTRVSGDVYVAEMTLTMPHTDEMTDTSSIEPPGSIEYSSMGDSLLRINIETTFIQKLKLTINTWIPTFKAGTFRENQKSQTVNTIIHKNSKIRKIHPTGTKMTTPLPGKSGEMKVSGTTAAFILVVLLLICYVAMKCSPTQSHHENLAEGRLPQHNSGAPLWTSNAIRMAVQGLQEIVLQ